MYSDTAGSWMPVALSADLPAGTVIPAWISAGEIALWRSQSGRVAASGERCPHRGMRLSHGFVRGDVLSCIYHGWSFAQSGQCVRIPAHPSLEPPATIRASSYPVVESDGIIWAAAGEPSGQPPGLDGRVPLRSMTFDAGAKTIEAAAGATADPNGVIVPPNRADVALLLAPRDDKRSLVHVLVADTADAAARIAASREVESLRRKAEALQNEGATP
jgi:nitrite reductase/ring-hydroxylating ferredoxin subunit